jgi:vitamin K-dependent gamma-carboxylase
MQTTIASTAEYVQSVSTTNRALWLTRLFTRVDIASLVVFRIAFGAIALWEVWRYFTYGWISRYYIEPAFHFSYFGFSWVKPWPGDGMYIHFYMLGLLAILIMVGAFYRLSAFAFFLAFTYVFLLDQARYLNHFYLFSLISFLMIFVPAHRALSVDAAVMPAIRSQTAPNWSLWMLRLQIGLVYFYGGLAKVNVDWLRGEPMREWMSYRTDFPIIGQWFTEEWMVYLFSYGGLLFDLLFFPLVLWKRTRWLALLVALGFHLTNAHLFSIGIFPWFMIAAGFLYLEPDWPRRFIPRLRQGAPSNGETPTQLSIGQKWIVGALALYFAFQLLFPLRHWLYPGDVNWTEEGHRFSWRMKLRDKDAYASFYATDPATNRTWEINPYDYVTDGQFDEMLSRPDMILQFVYHVADDLRGQGYDGIEIRALVEVSLNRREYQLMIDPSVDLAQQPWDLLPADWILPLKQT